MMRKDVLSWLSCVLKAEYKEPQQHPLFDAIRCYLLQSSFYNNLEVFIRFLMKSIKTSISIKGRGVGSPGKVRERPETAATLGRRSLEKLLRDVESDLLQPVNNYLPSSLRSLSLLINTEPRLSTLRQTMMTRRGVAKSSSPSYLDEQQQQHNDHQLDSILLKDINTLAEVIMWKRIFIP